MRSRVRVEMETSKAGHEDLVASVDLQCNLVWAISSLVLWAECSLLLENNRCLQEHIFGSVFYLKIVHSAHSTKAPNKYMISRDNRSTSNVHSLTKKILK